MPNTTTTPAVTPTITPAVSPAPWPDEFTSPDRICPQQRRETVSPDVAP